MTLKPGVTRIVAVLCGDGRREQFITDAEIIYEPDCGYVKVSVATVDGSQVRYVTIMSRMPIIIEDQDYTKLPPPGDVA